MAQKHQTSPPLHKHNDPIVILSNKLSKEAGLVLRVGRKFAFCPNLHKSLSWVIHQTDQKRKRIAKLSALEGIEWRKWNLSALEHVLSEEENPKKWLNNCLEKA